MYYTRMDCLDCGLGQITPEGKDCAEIERLYKREKRLSKSRSKASHRKRHKTNAERLEPAYNECQGEPGHRIVPEAGGMPELVSTLTPWEAEQIVSGGTPPVNYGRIAGLVIGGAVLLGGLIYLTKPKRGKPA
jgi:hypothetical protein